MPEQKHSKFRYNHIFISESRFKKIKQTKMNDDIAMVQRPSKENLLITPGGSSSGETILE